MSKKFDIISIFLIVVLAIILFFVIFGYFFNSSSILTTVQNHDINDLSIITSGDDIATIISNNYKKSGDSKIINTEDENNLIEDELNNADILDSGDTIIHQEASNDDQSQVPSSKPTSSNPNQLILSSDSNISSKEKKQVLNELDQTLMELLEVVDSVKTVDESRLIVDEGEVQP